MNKWIGKSKNERHKMRFEKIDLISHFLIRAPYTYNHYLFSITFFELKHTHTQLD